MGPARLRPLLWIAASASVAHLARAGPADTFGFGSRGAAMGSAVAADVEDFSANYYNPAGLVGGRGTDLSIGYMRADHRLRIDGRDNHVDPVKGLVGGLVGRGDVIGLPFAFGFAVHLPDDRLSRIRTLRQEQPRWELYDNRAQLVFIAANVAVRPWPWLEAGGGLGFLAATRGRLDVSGVADIRQPYDSELRHEVDADLTPVRYPQAGIRIRLPRGAALALVYRAEARLHLKLRSYLHGHVRTAIGDVPATYLLESDSVDAFNPRQIVLGASWRPAPRLHANLDLVWVNWSAYEPATSRSSAHLDVAVPAGLPLVIPPDPRPTEPRPARFSDRIVPRAGAEWTVPVAPAVEVAARAGYAFEKSPAPPQTGITNYVDVDRHVASAGAGVRLVRPIAEITGDLRLDAHVAYSILPETTTYKQNPADFVGDYRAGGTILSWGATLGMGLW